VLKVVPTGGAGETKRSFVAARVWLNDAEPSLMVGLVSLRI
jgi:hypothetical protein